MEDAVEAGGGERLHHSVSGEGAAEDEDEDGRVVPAEDEGHDHHLALAVLVPLSPDWWVQNEPDLEEPRPLRRLGGGDRRGGEHERRRDRRRGGRMMGRDSDAHGGDGGGGEHERRGRRKEGRRMSVLVVRTREGEVEVNVGMMKGRMDFGEGRKEEQDLRKKEKPKRGKEHNKGFGEGKK